MDINERIARRLIQLREERGLTIEDLANRSAVSRAMISRIERAESSPSATVLNKLSIGLGVLLPSLLGATGYREPRLQLRNPVASRRGQAEWQDPSTGYRRRTLTPTTANHAMQLSEVHFPGRATVTFDSATGSGARQQLWMLRGQLEIRIGDEFTTISAGDCMAMTLDRAITFHNRGSKEARYLIAVMPSA
ncbi:MAG: XRE family transcriptional regulator [Steroidobacteraceae bacterium]